MRQLGILSAHRSRKPCDCLKPSHPIVVCTIEERRALLLLPIARTSLRAAVIRSRSIGTEPRRCGVAHTLDPVGR